MRRAFLRALRSVKARGAQTRCCHPHFPGGRGRIFWGANAGICFFEDFNNVGVVGVMDVIIVIIVINDFNVIDDFNGEAAGLRARRGDPENNISAWREGGSFRSGADD